MQFGVVVVIKNRLALFFALFSLAVMGVIAFALNPFGSVRINVPGHSYKIPKKYLDESPLFLYFDNMGGMDDSSQSVSLFFPDAEVIAAIPQFQPRIPGYATYVDERLSIIVHGMDEKNMEYINSRVHDKDLWLGVGSYSDDQLGRKIQYDEEVGLYRIYFRDIKKSWAFSTINPEVSSEPLAPINAIVGRCRDKVRMGKRHYNCIYGHVRGNLNITYWISEANFKLYPEIDAFIFKKLSEWEIKEGAKNDF